MAIFNEILSGRFNRSLQKIFGIKGSPPVRQLGGEIMPVHIVQSGAEHRYLESWQRYCVAFDVAAVAANQSGWRLRNPTTSNVIAVFEKILLAATALDSYFLRIGLTSVDLANPSTLTNARLDNRGTQSPTLVGTQQNTAVTVPTFGGIIMEPFIAANTNIDLIATDIQEFPMLPGDALQMSCNQVNERLITTVMWRERALEESEKT